MLGIHRGPAIRQSHKGPHSSVRVGMEEIHRGRSALLPVSPPGDLVAGAKWDDLNRAALPLSRFLVRASLLMDLFR